MSILEVGRGTVEVLATGGDSRLGGDDLDVAVARWMSKECDKKGLIVDFRGAFVKREENERETVDADMVNVPLPPDGEEVAFTRQMLESVRECFATNATTVRGMLDSAGVNLERLRQIEEAKNRKRSKFHALSLAGRSIEFC